MSWLIKSSIGRKFVMSISGLFMILFLLFHMSMNLALVFSLEAYDKICEFLGANWYAVIGTLVLAAGFAVHVIYAIILTLQNRKARGKERYESSSKTPTQWSSKNMFVLGLCILLFLILHLYQLWFNMQFKELIGDPTAVGKGSELIIPLFQNIWVVLVYLAAFVLLWFHLTHGFWSALHTIGWSNKVWLKRIQVIGNIFATLILIGFSIIPIYIYFAY